MPGGRLRRGESEARGIARELFEETGLRLPEAAFTRVRVVDDADRIASYQDGTVWRMVIVLFRAQLPQEPELHCSRESCTLRFFTPEELRTADLVPTHRDLIEAWRPAPLEVAARTGLPAVLPRVFSDSEQGQIEMLLGEAMSRGTNTVLVGNIGHIPLARRLGFAVHGDFGLNAYNSRTLCALAEMGVSRQTLSFEARLAQIRDMSGPLEPF